MSKTTSNILDKDAIKMHVSLNRYRTCNIDKRYLHGKNNFAEGFKMFAGYKSENNFVGILKIMNNATKKF